MKAQLISPEELKITNNRKINFSRVKEIAKSIQKNNFLELFPIIVNDNLEILDGQHRAYAASECGVKVWIIKSNNIGVLDIAEINKTVKHWKLEDYIRFFAPHNEACKTILDKMEEWNQALEFVLVLTGMAGKVYKEYIKDGTLQHNEQRWKLAEIHYKWLVDFKEVFKYYQRRSFILAAKAMFRTREYDHSYMKKKFEVCSRSFVRCVDTDQYVQMLEDIYNHHTPIKKKINITRNKLWNT